MMALVEIASSRGGAVRTITLADQERRNALSEALVDDLLDAFRAADADPEVRVVVLTNAGRVFCAGANLRERTDDVAAPPAAIRRPAELFGHVRRSPKAYVGRIAGHCIAGGMGLAASMDIAIAVDDATFGFTEVRIGVAPAVIGVPCLPKMRPVDARAAMLRGTRLSADDVVRMGLIAAAVPRDALDAEVSAVVDDLLLGAPGAIAATKQLLDRVPTMGVDEAYDWTAELSARLFAGEEGREGIAAYLAKRRPSWAPPL